MHLIPERVLAPVRGARAEGPVVARAKPAAGDPAFEGQGVGSALARGALDDAIHRGDRRIKVVCPFIRAWVERHPDYQELLEPSRQS